MKKISILLMILFISCEAPLNGISEDDINTFEINVKITYEFESSK